MNETVFLLGGQAVTPAHLVATLALLALALFLAVLALAMRARGGRRAAAEAQASARETEARLRQMASGQAELAGRMQTIAEVFGNRQAELTRTMDSRLDSMTQRLGQSIEGQTKATGDNLAKLHERLAVIDAAQANITDLSSRMVTLQEILSNKQTRGAFGQARMEQIVADGLPSSAYTFQHTLSNGRRPDCAIRLPDQAGLIVIDAKFPLEAYNAVKAAETGEEAKAAGTRFRQDMGRHVGDIAERYLLPGETQDTAILFVPSESIYAELHENFDDVIQKAYRARVVIVSPSLLMLSIQVMQAVLKDARMREQAGLIQGQVAYLMDDVRRLRERVGKLKRHFEQAGEDISGIVTSADKIGARAGKIEALELEDEPARPDLAGDGRKPDAAPAEGAASGPRLRLFAEE